jgi:hypothetical protein
VFLASLRTQSMSSLPLHSDTVFTDIHSSLRIARAAVALGQHEAALGVMRALQARTAEIMRLPAHHHRRMLMRELGFLHLRHIDVPFDSLCSPESGVVFTANEVGVIPPTSRFAKLCRTSPTDFYAHTRLTLTEFLILFQELQPFILKPRRADVQAEYSADHRARYSHRKLHAADELLLWLYHADGNKDTVLSSLFKIDRTSVIIYCDHVTRCMNEAWKEEVVWPSKEDRELLHGLFSINEKAVAAIDGTHCQIDVPDNAEEEETAYSAYKKYHTQNYLVCCDALGFILHIVGPYKGASNDRDCFLASDFLDPELRMLEPDEKIITDGGFSSPLFPMNLHPYTAPQLADAATAEDRAVMDAFNDELKLNRSLNEHVNHVLKARAQALAGKWSRSKARQRDVLFVAARFTNRIRRLRLEYRLYCMQVERQAEMQAEMHV